MDLVLPTVPNTSDFAKFAMKFCNSNSAIIEMTGQARVQPVGFKRAGSPPLHLNIWFKPGAESVIQTLIDQLEQKAKVLENQTQG